MRQGEERISRHGENKSQPQTNLGLNKSKSQIYLRPSKTCKKSLFNCLLVEQLLVTLNQFFWYYCAITLKKGHWNASYIEYTDKANEIQFLKRAAQDS